MLQVCCEIQTEESNKVSLFRRLLCSLYTISSVYCVHTHTFNGPLSGTTQVSRYQKDKSNLDFNEARDSERQWHQLGHMQVCTSLQTDNHASTPPLSFFTGRMLFLPPSQQRQSTEIICTVLLLHKYYEHLIAASFQQLVEHFCSKNDIHQFTQQNKCENRSRGQLLTDVFLEPLWSTW